MIHFHRKKYDYDLIVLGSGGGGNVGAFHAAGLGKKVALFEKGDIGGECPTWACVPTKALLHAGDVYTSAKNAKQYGIHVKELSVHYEKVRDWKNLVVSRTGAAEGEEPFRKAGIDLIREKASFISEHEVEAGGKVYSAAKFLLATGATSFIPPLEGLEDAGYITFEKAVDLKEVPESMLIIGSGPVGCEFAHHFSRFGCEVTITNRSEKLLSNEDGEVSDLVQALFENDGINVLTKTVIKKIVKKGNKKEVHMQRGESHMVKEVDEILVAAGKIACLSFSPEKAGIHIIDHRLKVNKYLQTNVSHIFAAGDIIGPFQFTHTATYQSFVATHNAFANKKIAADYSVVPRCVFVSPEVASVGMSENEATAKGIIIKKGITPLAVIGRANTSNQFDGFVKVVTDKKGVLIGASIVAPRAGEMIHELALAIKLRVKASVVAEMIHAYPTYSEAVKIACSMVD